MFFAISGLIGTLCIMQSNQFTEAITSIFFTPEQNTLTLRFIIGVIITVIVACVVLGGIKRISKVATKVVPAMVVMYFLLVMYIILTHLNEVPGVFGAIFKDALTVKAGVGGGIGALVSIALIGIRRAALVNEAGVGTASMMHGASKNSEPVKEGLVAMIGPSIDSGLVCTLTAIAILIQRDVLALGDGISGSIAGLSVALQAFDASIPGVGKYLLLAMLFFFAFSTMFSYSYYGQKCTGFLFGAKYSKYYNIFFLAMLIVAAMIPLKAAVGLIDLAYALMAFPTMFTLLKLSPKVKAAMKEYFSKN